MDGEYLGASKSGDVNKVLECLSNGVNPHVTNPVCNKLFLILLFIEELLGLTTKKSITLLLKISMSV